MHQHCSKGYGGRQSYLTIANFSSTSTATVACFLAVLALAGCSGSSGAPTSTVGTATTDVELTTPTKSTRPSNPAPDVGECRNLSFADISQYSNGSKTADCSDEHTAYTFAVKGLPSDVAFEGVEIENDAVQSAASDACLDSFEKFIGGDEADLALSRLTVTYFLPKQAEFDLEAHWVRCDVVALETPSALATLPKAIEGYLDDDDALTDFGLCSQGDPGSSGALLLMCSQAHTYRAAAALSLGPASAPYPGERDALDAGKSRCQDLIREKIGAVSGFTYAWTYPSAQEWSAGSRFGFCWNQQTD